MKPILSICIPTYNRLPYLKELLEKLVPQLTDNVEVLVSDNYSDDGTWEYLLSLDSIKKHRNEKNLGLGLNFQSALQMSNSIYAWILSDDDLPSVNLIANIFEAITLYNQPPIIYLRTYPMQQNSEGYNPNIFTDWEIYSFEEFLKEIGIWFTFASSIVVRKDCIDFNFVEKWIDKLLNPAAITLTAALYEKKVILSKEPVLAARGNNSGGYDGITVFTKNVNLLLNEFSNIISKSTIKKICEESLLVIPYILSQNKNRSYNFSFSSLLNLIQYGWRYKAFYTVIIPALIVEKLFFFNMISKLTRTLTKFPKQYFKKIVKQALESIQNEECLKIKSSFNFCGKNIQLGIDMEVINPNNISIGDDFCCGRNIRLHCWKKEQNKVPLLTLGKNIFINSFSYISCADKIDIADNVLIGSNVFITDNYHGDTSKVVRSRINAQLFIKGPVNINSGVWIGNNVCILPNVSIGENSIIGANSVVNSNIPSNVVAAGVPARIVKILHSE